MKEDKQMEQILLNDEKYEKFVVQKLENEFSQILNETNEKKSQEITDFTKVPKEEIFSKNIIYMVINKQSRTKSYINGIQAESFVASQDNIRNKLLKGLSESFVCGDYFVKFYKWKK